jgi:hypothetical protein
MKKILLLIVIAITMASCGPSARELEEKRLQDSINSVNSHTTEEAPVFKVTYYKDETSGIVFAVMQCCGELKMEIVPSNQTMGINNFNKIKSN